jgi:hypothetical protein
MNRLETWWIWAGVQCAAALRAGGRLRTGLIALGSEAMAKVCGVAMAKLPG